ncbi:peptidoglycan-binding protein [uncultured Paludibaculum sp.]|uniref:peptidoglycan-binding domain-containing protein n=1 Tax=uncultured Paludibaculum sp. TaxID=1765020 RepID=UPI002AABB30E|nr:peptidoglycan-binding protein [uncultured Paludibaculum sp.]
MKPLRPQFLPFVLLLALALPALSVTTKKPVAKAPAQKSSVAKSAPSKSAAAKAPATKSGAKPSSKRRGTVAKRRVTTPRRTTQQLPTEDRVREIQQALTAKGYAVDANGVWGQESTEALKKFQEDQNINNMSGRGKLDSLTLIALGLGPKREPPPQTAPPVQPPAATEGKLP